MRIEIEYNGALAICKVDGKYLYQCDKETIIRVLSAFPTAEMRDAFYESFKDLIEKCKKLL